MSDYRVGEILLLVNRGRHGVQSMRADAFRLEMARLELQTMQQEGSADTYGLTMKRCIREAVSDVEPAQFELMAELFAVYSPVWQFAITWKAPLASGAHRRPGKLDQYYSVCQPELSAWMTRVWLGDSYQRIPLSLFAQADAFLACIEFFLQSGGDRLPAVQWLSDADLAWKFYIHPEDELPNPLESPIRPATKMAPPELEVHRQLRQVAFEIDAARQSFDMPAQPGLLYEAGTGAEVGPLNDLTLAQVREALNLTDWSRSTRYVSIFQQESRFSPLLGYVALHGHPLGVFAELVVPSRHSDDHYCVYNPLAAVTSELMVRIWVGMHYRRVSLDSLVQPSRAIEFVMGFLGQQSPQRLLFQWPSEDDDRLTRISPEDDFYDPLELRTRPFSKTSVSTDELQERLKTNYTAVGLPTHALQLR